MLNVLENTPRVLAHVNFGDRNPSDIFLMSSSNDTTWNWWRSGIIVVELAKLNVLPVTKREASLVAQWMLRHDFEEWTDPKLVVKYLQPLIAQIGALVAQYLRPSGPTRWILSENIGGGLVCSLG
ncbi:hypothetical protein DVH05_009555 [Phytophthora capsici]|nr:hypothetical protein DVH05_009555 [Phytophthora capsici]